MRILRRPLVASHSTPSHSTPSSSKARSYTRNSIPPRVKSTLRPEKTPVQTPYSVVQTLIEKNLITNSEIRKDLSPPSKGPGDVVIEFVDTNNQKYLVRVNYDQKNNLFYPPLIEDELESITLEKIEDWIKRRIITEYQERADLSSNTRIVEFRDDQNSRYLVPLNDEVKEKEVEVSAYESLIQTLNGLGAKEAVEFLVNHLDFTTALLKNNGDVNIKTFLRHLPPVLKESLASFSAGNNLDDFLYTTFVLLYQQTVTDPPYYVSHAVDHSIRVAGKMLELLDTIPLLRKVLKNTYEFDPEFMVFLTAIIHDVGYSDLVYCYGGKPDVFHMGTSCDDNVGIPSKYKFLHSVAGANMVTKMYGVKLMKMLGEKAYTSIVSAVRQHNFDSEKCKRDHEDCSFKTTPQHHTKYLESGKLYKREYEQADIETNPLLFALRITDNLDFEFVRLTQVQQDESLMLVQRLLYLDPRSTEPLYLKERIEQLRSSIDISEYSEKDKFIMERIISELKKNEFLFNYSNWIVERVKFEKSGSRYLMSVYFRGSRENIRGSASHGLRGNVSPVLEVDQNFYPATYQIVRCAESFSSLSSQGTNLVDLVDVNLHYANGAVDSQPLTSYLLSK